MKRTIYYGDETWVLHENGAIERPGLVMPDPRSWRVVGAVRLNSFGFAVERASLADILAGKITDWQYKNGVQKWHILDMDHGTLREWRSPNHRVV